jgi:hypothetical protein
MGILDDFAEDATYNRVRVMEDEAWRRDWIKRKIKTVDHWEVVSEGIFGSEHELMQAYHSNDLADMGRIVYQGMNKYMMTLAEKARQNAIDDGEIDE